MTEKSFLYASSAALILISAVSCIQCRKSSEGYGAENVEASYPVAESPATEAHDSCSASVLTFLRSNAVPVSADSFGALREAAAFPDVILDEFISIDKVNEIADAYQREDRIRLLKDSGRHFSYHGKMDISDKLECFIYSVAQNHDGQEAKSVYALIIRNGCAVGDLLLFCNDKESGFVTETRKVSRNVFDISTFSVDMIDIDGNPKGGTDRIEILDNGSMSKVVSVD